MKATDYPTAVAKSRAYFADVKARLAALKKSGDPELAHFEADLILCEVLLVLGQKEVVDGWQAVEKWYA